jgi:hypothetical protein
MSISGGADGVGAVVDGAARISGGADGVGAVVDGGMAHAWAQHTRGHVHLLWQMLHQVLHAYLIARPQRRDHCEPSSTCP